MRGMCSQRYVTPLPLGSNAGLVKVVLEAVIYVVPEQNPCSLTNVFEYQLLQQLALSSPLHQRASVAISDAQYLLCPLDVEKWSKAS